MQVHFSKNNATQAHNAPLAGYDSPEVMLDQFLAHLLGEASVDTYTFSANSPKKTDPPAASKPSALEHVHTIFNKAKDTKVPSIGSAVSIGVGAFIKAALVTPFYFVCRLFGMPKLTFMQRAAVIGGNSVYQGYVKPAFAVNA